MTPQTPQKIWSRSSADMFMEASGIGSTPTAQQLVCHVCATSGIYDVPPKIAMVNGSSVCMEHIYPQ